MKKKTGGQKATFQGDVIRRILAEKDMEELEQELKDTHESLREALDMIDEKKERIQELLEALSDIERITRRI